MGYKNKKTKNFGIYFIILYYTKIFKELTRNN